MVAGHLSVTVFIVVSGFCLTLPVVAQGGELRGGVLGFLKRRARRILPPYYAAVVLCLILIWTVIGKPTGSLWDYPLRVTPFAIVSHLLLIQDLFATSRINYVFWSIAVEWQIYFLVPLLVWAWRRYGAAKTVLASLLLGFALRFGFAETRLVRAHPQFLGMFTLGMLAAYIVRSPDPRFVRLREHGRWALLSLFAFALVVGLSLWGGIGWSEGHFHWFDLPIGVMTASALAAAARSESGALNRVFSWPPLVAIGTFSYSLYLIHAPLLQVMWQYGLVPLGISNESMLGWLLSLGLALVIACSYAFFRLFEAPFMRAPQRAPTPRPEPVS
jgi:peptidoglycan/LPS O-acetylase OafA/YrhL